MGEKRSNPFLSLPHDSPNLPSLCLFSMSLSSLSLVLEIKRLNSEDMERRETEERDGPFFLFPNHHFIPAEPMDGLGSERSVPSFPF